MQTINRFESNRIPVKAILFIFASIFIASIFTYDLYNQVIIAREQLSTVRSETESSSKLLEKLNEYKSSASVNPDVERYGGLFREDLILESIFALAGSGAQIGNITLDKGEKLASGISLGNISVSIQANTLGEMLTFMDSVTGAESKRRYLIRSVSLPFSTSTTLPATAVIQLGLYYLK